MKKIKIEVIHLGDIVKEKITGLEGVVMARTEFLTGCSHLAILPQTLDDKGNMKEWVWLDETRFEKIDKPSVQIMEYGESIDKGGPQPHPSCR